MRSADNGEAGFRATGGALVRAAHHCGLQLPPWPDLTSAGPDRVTVWVGWLRRVWAIPQVADALGHASPQLDQQIRALCATDAPGVRQTRRAVVSVARYLRRMTGRPTPSGLLAGVAPATFGDQPHMRWGAGHRAVARADAAWVADIIRQVEGCPEALERLAVIVNSTVMVRGDRLIVPHQPHADERGTSAVEVSLRHTDAVRVAVEAARKPVRLGEVVEQLVATLHSATSVKATAMLTELVARRALITSLHAPSTEPDALGWLLEHLETAGASEVAPIADLFAELKEIHALLEQHNQAPADQSRAMRAEVAARMARLGRTPRHPVAVDLRLDASIVLPAEVAREAERAALILARVSAHPHGTPAWRDYHRRFYERFGSGSLVPLLEVVADSGIGWPDGYPGTASPEQRGEHSRRDETLLSLAQAAALDGRVEVVLSEPLITDLEPDDARRVRLPAHLELCVRVHASHLSALQRGDFQLTVVSVSRAAGVVTGRFLSILEPDGRRELAAGLTGLPGSDPDTVCAQVSFPPLDPATAHVARAVRTLPALISLAEHRDITADSGVLTPIDLAVGCDSHRLYLAAPARGERLDAWGMHALNLRTHTPPLARFVTELCHALCAQVTAFDWGAAALLPFLPRLRSGRTMLAPARWRIDAAELPARSAGWERWDAALAGLRTRRRIPRLVHLVEDDRLLPLDLEETGHRVLLRDHLYTQRNAVLEEAPDEMAVGWCGGWAHEVVVPLAASQPPTWPRLPRPTQERIVGRDHGHVPGTSRLLFAKLYGDVHRQDLILAEHLPALLARWGEEQPVWWFLRFREGRDHYLRLRITLLDSGPEAFGEAARRVGAWADDLRGRGLLREVAYATSYPETGRWGSGEVLAAAEAVFTADSRTVLAQLAQPARPHPRVLVAANFAAIAIAFTGSITVAMEWLISHVPATAPVAVPRPVFAGAVRLADPCDDFHALRLVPGGMPVVNSWAERSTALAAYRARLLGLHAAGIDADDVLGSLLHVHFLRACGIDPQEKAMCFYLARAAALAHVARTGGRR
ncbi:MAG: lantibiotic dehydratase [Pseudonocardiaceae bacterium]